MKRFQIGLPLLAVLGVLAWHQQATAQSSARSDGEGGLQPFRPGSIRLAPVTAPGAVPGAPTPAADRDDIPPARMATGAPQQQPGSPTLAPPDGRDSTAPGFGPGSVRTADNRYMAQPQTGGDGPPGTFPSLSPARPIGSNTEDGALSATGAGKPGPQHLQGLQSPSLTVEQIAPDEVQVGKPAVFEIRVRNVGSVTAHDVRVEEEIPQGAQLISTKPSRQSWLCG